MATRAYAFAGFDDWFADIAWTKGRKPGLTPGVLVIVTGPSLEAIKQCISVQLEGDDLYIRYHRREHCGEDCEKDDFSVKVLFPKPKRPDSAPHVRRLPQLVAVAEHRAA